MRATRMRHKPCMHLAPLSRAAVRSRSTLWNFLVRHIVAIFFAAKQSPVVPSVRTVL